MCQFCDRSKLTKDERETVKSVLVAYGEKTANWGSALPHAEQLLIEARIVALAMCDTTSPTWMATAMPHLLASDGIDAMTKLRLAARWAVARS